MKDNEMKKFYYLSVLLHKGKLLENFFGSTINLWGGCGLDDGGGREVGGGNDGWVFDDGGGGGYSGKEQRMGGWKVGGKREEW